MTAFFLGFFSFPVLCMIGAFVYLFATYLRQKHLASKCRKAQLEASKHIQTANSIADVWALMEQSSIRVARIEDAGIANWPVMVDEMDLFSALQKRQNDIVRNN